MKDLRVYVLTMGNKLYYVTEDDEDAEYEKEMAEKENPLGRKQCIQLHEVHLDDSDLDADVQVGNYTFKVSEILDLL